MALEAVTDRQHNVIGNRREDMGTFEASGQFGHVATRLHYIESMTIWGTKQQTSNIFVYKNSALGQVTSEDAPGFFYYLRAGGGDPTGNTYQFIAVGW